MTSKLNVSSLPNDVVLQTCFGYLDAPSLANATAANKAWKSLPTNTAFSTALVFAKQVDTLRRNRDMYALLRCDLPAELRANTKSKTNGFRIDACRIVEHIFKRSMREAVALYIKSETRTFTIDNEQVSVEYKAIKLIGRDAREPIEREKHVLLKPLKASDGSMTFKMSSFAAQTLGTIIREDESINALMIQSLPDPAAFFRTHHHLPDQADLANFVNESFNDQTAVTLLRALPAGRLKLFGLAGGFGHETMKEYIKLMPSLYDSVPRMDPQDTLLVPLCPLADDQQKNDAELDKYMTQTQEYFASKAKKDPNSIANCQNQCVIM